MLEELIKDSEELFKGVEKIHQFFNRYGVYYYIEAEKIMTELFKLTESIPDIKNPKNQNELLLSELKRRSELNIYSINKYMMHHKISYDFDEIISILGITRSDIAMLSNWLKDEKIKTLESIERLFQTRNIQNFDTEQNISIEEYQKQSAETEIDIQRYHTNLGKLIEEKTEIKEFLRQIKIVPTYAYFVKGCFNKATKTIEINISDIYNLSENRNLQLKERELIEIYAHEGGHALKCIVTNSNNLPYFLNPIHTAISTIITNESLASFYENIIFKDLKNSPKTQKELGINNKFNKIYEDAEDIHKINEYQSNLLYYCTAIFADKTIFGVFDDKKGFDKRVELISKVLLHPAQLSELIDQITPHFDKENNFDMEIMNYITSAAQPVVRALEEFRKRGIIYDEKGRSKIDEAFLTGYWTPKGFIDNARLKAQE